MSTDWLLFLFVLGTALGSVGAVSLVIVLTVHVEAVRNGTSLKKFRSIERRLHAGLLVPGIVVSGCAGALLLSGASPRPMWMLAAALSHGVGLAAATWLAVASWNTLQDPVHVGRMGFYRSIGVVVFACAVALVWAMFPLRIGGA